MFEVNPNLLNQLRNSFAEQPLLISENYCWTFAEFLDESFMLSKSLSITAQKRIVLCTENPDFLLKAMLALWFKDTVAVPLNPKFPAKQKNELIHKIGGQKNEILDGELSTLLQAKTNFPKLRNSKANPQQRHLINPEAWATIIFTSGSSGSPKAVVHSLANHFYSALGANEIMPLNPGDRWLLSLPLFHVGGLAIFFRTLISGSAMVIPSKNETLAETIIRKKITHLSLVPTQLHRLLQTSAGKNSLQSLKLILLGGSAIPERLLEQSEKLGLKLNTTYGSTEMASQVATGKKGNCRVLPFREIRISTASNSKNEIEVRGKTRFLGYLENKLLLQPFDENGWFKTGDLGEIQLSNFENNQNSFVEPKNPEAENNGALSVFGRKDNMFISGGENIHPEEIERVILKSGIVEQTVVVSIKDVEFGERPVAFVKYSEPDSDSELRKFLEKHLLRFKLPALFLEWPEEVEIGLKPKRHQLSKLAQQQFILLQKQNLAENKLRHPDFEKWLNQFPLGWRKIALSAGKQIFLLLDQRNEFRKKGLYIRANSRKEVMEWILAKENFSLFNVKNEKNERSLWFPVSESRRGKQKECFEIIRILVDELPAKQIYLYDAQDRGTFKTFLLHENTQKVNLQKCAEFASTENQIKSVVAEKIKQDWDWKFPEAVFQSGIFLPDFNRMYLLRCLYRRSVSAKKFLGWKVQLLRDLSSSENMENPFWELSLMEENALACELEKTCLISKNDFELSNTPQKERERRIDFQILIDKLYS